MADVLAILPLCITALSGITLMFKQIKIMKSHATELRKIKRSVRIQSRRFRNELFRIIVSSDCSSVTQAELHKALHGKRSEAAPQWAMPELENSILVYLGESHGELCECIDDFILLSKNITQKLEAFHEEKRTYKNAVRMVVQRPDLKSQISDMKDINEVLAEIREAAQLAKGSAPRVNPTGPPGKEASSRPPDYEEAVAYSAFTKHPQAVARQYETSRTMMQSFLYTFRRSRKCIDPSHRQHSLQVFIRCLSSRPLIEARVACLLGVLIADARAQTSISIPFEVFQSPLQLSNVSTRSCSPLAADTPPTSSHSHSTCFTDVVMETVDNQPPPEKKIKLSIEAMPTVTSPVAYSTFGAAEEFLLCQSVHGQNSSQGCGVGLENVTVKTSTWCFDFEGHRSQMLPKVAGQRRTLLEMLRFPKDEVIGDPQRVELALLLARGLLKLHGTACWPRGCLMSRVSLYTGSGRRQDEYGYCHDNDDDGGDGDEQGNEIDLAACMDTLHISTPARKAGQEGVELSKEDLDEIQFKYGVGNVYLYSLGVAVLQIGLWEPIPWHDVEQVRRKLSRLNYLGMAYQNLAKRLIHCRFGPATSSLREEELQVAVVRDVVQQLEKLLDLVTGSY